MPKWSKDIERTPALEPEKPRFPRLLTLAQVKEILNVGMPAVYALVSSGELRALQLSGGRRMWRVSEDDLEAYLERCYQETEERIAAGTIKAEALDGED
ncbi:helix-turn-helix domain-containing protein [Crystallibacter degradans]|uniref:helix-turn-helix domain-containing protein n=1 Tax=Crystallibacter degradans TaxID=2726743 RepID=UPI0014740B37|nr:helix-turn-helix domain-containing protein [Arthrobacter sp. SF27]NMR32361.1 helix-turn-helix domain-containing protein [Arthrobacter sp. SF27]